MTFQSLIIASAIGISSLVAAHSVSAQSQASIIAHAHFNESADNATDLRHPQSTPSGVVVSTRGNGPLARAFAQFNQDADTASDLRGTQQATVYGGRPAFGASIFADLRAAAREDEN